jgi:NAD(P)H dehydrogenase (quinone)
MYVVLGATGNTGGATARELLERGFDVRVVMRSEAKAESWRDLGADVALADYRDVASLKRAVAGSKGVFLMNPPPDQEPNPIEAAKRQAEVYRELLSLVPRTVVLSSVGAHKAHGTGSIRTLNVLENTLRDERVVFLRPGYFAENWLNVIPLATSQGFLPTFLQPLDQTVPMVATADIGAAAADLLVANEVPKVVELLGPHDLSPRDLALQLSQALGREIAAVAVSPSEWSEQVSQWGLSQSAADLIMEMYRGINSKQVDVESPESVWRGRTEISQALLASFASPAGAVL